MKQVPVTLPITRNAKLMHLYSIIEEVDPDLINIEEWVCGTSYCIAGWATQDPIFRSMGLKLRPGFDCLIPGFGMRISDEALRDFFDLSYSDERFLFHDYNNLEGEAAKQEALSKIERLMI